MGPVLLKTVSSKSSRVYEGGASSEVRSMPDMIFTSSKIISVTSTSWLPKVQSEDMCKTVSWSNA